MKRSKEILLATSLTASCLGLTACLGVQKTNVIDPSESSKVFEGLERYGYSPPDLIIADARYLPGHSNVHVDIKTLDCPTAVDVPLETATTEQGIVWYPVEPGPTHERAVQIPPERFEEVFPCPS